MDYFGNKGQKSLSAGGSASKPRLASMARKCKTPV